MSRLFSRLENKGYEHNEGQMPAGPGEAADSHADADIPAAVGRGADMAAPASFGAPSMPSLAPGYVTGVVPGMPPSGPAVASPVWPVRAWLASLLLLAGLSLLILVLPERLLPLAAQQAPSGAGPRPDPAASMAPATGSKPAVVTQRSVPAAGAVAAAVPAPRAPRAERPRPAAASAPSSPSPSSASPGCSEAMLAMNLCSKSSP